MVKEQSSASLCVLSKPPVLLIFKLDVRCAQVEGNKHITELYILGA